MSEDRHPDGAIRVERRGNLLLIGIDRPQKLNGFSEKMVIELGEAYDLLEKDAAISVGVVHAIGPNFTAGVQLDQLGAWFADGRHVAPAGKIDPFDLFHPLRSKPVVVAVQGICYTLGIELMLAADIVIAADDTRFGQIEVRRGIYANHGATLRIVQRAGWGNAMRYLLTGDEFSAETAYRMGLVQEVVAPGQQLDRAIAMANIIAAQAPLAVRATIESARKGLFHGWPASIADFGPAQRQLMQSEDARDGLLSVKEKRQGRFTGR